MSCGQVRRQAHRPYIQYALKLCVMVSNIPCVQDMAAAEEEATRRGVQATSARKAAEKALADAAKAERQLTGVAEDLKAREAEFKVRNGTVAGGSTVTWRAVEDKQLRLADGPKWQQRCKHDHWCICQRPGAAHVRTAWRPCWHGQISTCNACMTLSRLAHTGVHVVVGFWCQMVSWGAWASHGHLHRKWRMPHSR